jgi:microcystin-dependent protein
VEIQVGGQWKEAADRTPVGMISAFGGTVAPDGWFICDGTAKSRSQYADLYAVVGLSFGAGDGSTTFNLPDLRGRFLRGTDGAAGRDSDAASRTAMASGGNTGNNIGSVQSDAFQGHKHDITFQTSGTGGTANYPLVRGSAVTASSSAFMTSTPSTDFTNGTPRIAPESRPTNANVNFIIKY